MAFSKVPENSTYRTNRFPLVGIPLQRNGQDLYKDQRFLNCFCEMIPNPMSGIKQFYVKKRAGLSGVGTPFVGHGRGMIFEPTSNKVYFVVDNVLFVYPIGGVINSIATITGGTDFVGFTIHEFSSTVNVVLLDGIAGWLVDVSNDAVTKITDPDFPSPHVPTPVSLDGYLFVAKARTADIYNSDLNLPLVWTPGNFISAELYPDFVVHLTKNNNYIYAIGNDSVEYFYDNANANGSPLQRNDSAVQQFGTDAHWSVIQTEKEVIMVGSTGNGGRTVWMIEGFKATEIAIEPVRQSLNAQGTTIGSTCTAYSVRSMGHKFYVLRLSDRTWVYDFDEKMWSEWSSFNGTTETTFRGIWGSDGNGGQPYMLDVTSGTLWLFSETTYQDSFVQITSQMTTYKLDYDTNNRKDFYRFTLYGDRPLALTSSLIGLEWTDDDYRTWHGPRQLDLCADLVVTRRLGKSRRRAFRLTYTDNAPMRLEGFELDINMGQT